jgi:hypothetical protein
MSFPVPVNLNRFLAPECDFIFGMSDPFPLLYYLHLAPSWMGRD